LWVTGISPKLARKNFPKIPLENTNDIAIQCLNEKRMFNISNIPDDSCVHEDIKILPGGMSFVLMPLVTNDSAIGVVGFSNPISHQAIDPETLQRYQRFVDTLAMFFNNSRIYAELEMLKNGLEDQVKERTAELKQAHETIWEINENLSAIIENSTIGIIATDPVGEIRVFNRAASEILNTRLSQLKASNIKHLIKSELVQKILETEPLEELESGVLYRNFETELSPGKADCESENLVPVSLSAVRLRNRERRVSGYVLVFQDIREVRFLEAKLIHAEKLKMIGQMAAGISHELNTPLAMIKASTAVIKKNQDSQNNEIVSKHLSFINDAVGRASCFVKDFLTLAKPTETFLQKAEIKDIVNKAIELFRLKIRMEKIDFQTSFIEELLPAYCDVNKMIQVFINLFDNAVDAMGSSGIITVKAICRKVSPGDILMEDQLKRRSSDPPRSKLLNFRKFHLHDISKLPPVFEPEAQIIQIEVTDTGPGMSQTLIDNVCEPFFSTKSGNGSGLGLTISQGIIREHHGCLTLISKPGEGVTAIIKLPTYATMVKFERITQ
jgi:PAS domain S-box-containing protein